MILEISSELVLKEHINFTIEELRYGYDLGLITGPTVVSIAVAEVIRGETEQGLFDLSALLSDEVHKVDSILEEFKLDENVGNQSTTARKWLYLQLKAAYLRSDELHDPLGVVEEIYADFDYPPSIAHFVRYMPAQSSEVESELGEAALLRKWAEYLSTEKQQLMLD